MWHPTTRPPNRSAVLRAPRPEDAAIGFGSPEGASTSLPKRIEPAHHNWLVHRDLAEDISVLEVVKDEGRWCIEAIDMEVGDCWEWYTYQGDDFNSARGETLTERCFRRGDWSVRTT